MKNLPDMSKYPSPLKITFEDGRVWEGAILDGYARAQPDPQPDEEYEEDEIYVSYQGLGYSIPASRIRKLESQKSAN